MMRERTSLRTRTLLLTVSLVLHAQGTLSDASVRVRSTSPAILDSPIRFEAQLEDADDLEGPFVFRWSDNASPANWKEVKENSKSSQFTLTYSSREYEADNYTMTVMVFASVGFFREEVASKLIPFEITKDIRGKVLVNQRLSEPDEVVIGSTLNDTVFNVDLYDPLEFYKNSTLVYYWFINESNFGMTRDPNFTYHFLTPGVNRIEVTVLAYFVNETIKEFPDLPLPQTNSIRGFESQSKVPENKYGILKTRLDIRTPLLKLNVTGSSWLKHGQLLGLNITCDGTGPWHYCWSVKDKDYNITGNETCFNPEIMRGKCEFPITWYFSNSGIYDIFIQISNGLTVRRKLVHVNIYDVHRQAQVALLIIPVIASLSSVAVFACGIFAFLRFKRNLSVEIADFDFNPQEELLEHKTFWERLRDSMINAFQTSSDTVSHISSVSSRSAQQNVGNIHYGSIT